MAIAPKARVFWPVMSLWLLADCATKELAKTHLVTSVPEPVLGETVRWTLAYNPGAAMSISLGLGQYTRPFFAVVVSGAVILLANLYRRTDRHATVAGVAFALVIAGAVGNLLDRLRSGRGVVDFIDIGVGSWRFWTFNVADIGVTVGALLLAWQLSKADGQTAPSEVGVR